VKFNRAFVPIYRVTGARLAVISSGRIFRAAESAIIIREHFMGEAIHKGSCHCGKVKFEATLDLDRTVECNCSICTKRGSILSATAKEKLKVLSGEGALTDYQFNKHVIHHLFCPTCGILPFARGNKPDGTEMAMVNVRCLDDVDVSKLSPMAYDGKSK
jgi:hypothetical protein